MVGRSSGLTKRQHRVLEFIVRIVEEQGLPPTLREIGERFGIASTHGVWRHLHALERKGYIRRREGQARGIELITERVHKLFYGRHHIPLVGRVAAGEPVLAVENIEELLSLEELFPAEGSFALRIQGERDQDAYPAWLGARSTGSADNVEIVTRHGRSFSKKTSLST